MHLSPVSTRQVMVPLLPPLLIHILLNVLLTMHYNIKFIPVTNLMHKILYSYNVRVLYVFRAVLCSSSGGQILCIRYMVLSLSVSGRGGRAVHRLGEN